MVLGQIFQKDCGYSPETKQSVGQTADIFKNSHFIHKIAERMCYNKIPFAPLTGERPGVPRIAGPSDPPAEAPFFPVFQSCRDTVTDSEPLRRSFFRICVKQRGGIFYL